MKKFFDQGLLLFLLFFPFFVSAETGLPSLKEKILKERIEKEKGEVSFAVKVSEQELEVIQTLAFNSLLKYRKLQFLKKSSVFMKNSCISFDSECKKLYKMSIVYLESELKTTKKELNEFEKLMNESSERLKNLKEKHELLEKGIEVETTEIRIKPVIPELFGAFQCSAVSGWNTSRGVFVTPAQINDLPIPVFVKDIVQLVSSGNVVMVEVGDFVVNFSYVKTPHVQKGEIVNIGKKLFTGASENPVMPGNILIFITKNGKFVNPVFMCK